ncbi:hypothetical protein Hamer_G019873 [Homarus americanus]|uniref:Uncharacterized protein n=1 Tax=Homarus americanus TaxID=6706 RepID=A0A8J5K3T5_HOMAM|nr:hypothetical protein Hamer_G019873 [Homarus americanus]
MVVARMLVLVVPPLAAEVRPRFVSETSSLVGIVPELSGLAVAAGDPLDVSDLVAGIIKEHLVLRETYMPYLVVDARHALSYPEGHLLQALKKGDRRFSCRAFLVDLSLRSTATLAFE